MQIRVVVAAIAMVLAAPDVLAQDSSDDDQQPQETLTHFLSRCDAGDADCRTEILAGFDVALNQMKFICPPGDLSPDQAADQELKWLRNAAAANETLANGGELDAEYTALNTLWPCDK